MISANSFKMRTPLKTKNGCQQDSGLGCQEDFLHGQTDPILRARQFRGGDRGRWNKAGPQVSRTIKADSTNSNKDVLEPSDKRDERPLFRSREMGIGPQGEVAAANVPIEQEEAIADHGVAPLSDF
jgi:hypothetical protein